MEETALGTRVWMYQDRLLYLKKNFRLMIIPSIFYTRIELIDPDPTRMGIASYIGKTQEISAAD